ncbi:hypothetical protein N0V95_002407 [Ascochyta clinopodiicola]|nr:hypothetical protein N0V95_002407 [Ascochyta clinopodiicola]
MYEVADKYEVVGLKDLAKEKFARACEHFRNTPEFSVAAHHAFSTTPEDDKGLRDVVIATIAAHMELIKEAEVKVLLTQLNGLALGILEQKIEENGCLYESADYSDLIITCGVETFKVHKAIEAASDKIDLPEDDPSIVKLLVQYLYEAEYEPVFTKHDPSQPIVKRVEITSSRIQGYHYCFPHTYYTSTDDKRTLKEDASQFLLHSQMYEIADKYDIAALKELAQSKFSYACRHWWNTEYFTPAAHHAFSTTPETDKGLRDIISTTISRRMELLNKPEVEAVLNEFNGLAVGILKLHATELGWI